MKIIYRPLISLILGIALLSSFSCGQSGDKPIILQVVAPTNLLATASGSYKIDLSWSDNSNNETYFAISRSILPDSGFTAISSTIAAGSTAYSDNTVLPSMTYYYKIYAYNESTRSSDSNVATATTANDPTGSPVLSEFDTIPSTSTSFDHILKLIEGNIYSIRFIGENFTNDSKVLFVLGGTENELTPSSITVDPSGQDKLTLSNIPSSFFTSTGDYSVYIKNDDFHKSQSMVLSVAYPLPVNSDCTSSVIPGIPNGDYKIYLDPLIYSDSTPDSGEEPHYPSQHVEEHCNQYYCYEDYYHYGFNFIFNSVRFYIETGTSLNTKLDAYNLYVATGHNIEVPVTNGTISAIFTDKSVYPSCDDNNGRGNFLVQKME